MSNKSRLTKEQLVGIDFYLKFLFSTLYKKSIRLNNVKQHNNQLLSSYNIEGTTHSSSERDFCPSSLLPETS